MNAPADILPTVADVVAAMFRIPVQAVTPDTDAADVQGWDSLAHGQVIIAIERRFGVRLPARRAFTAANVGELCSLVAEVRAS